MVTFLHSLAEARIRDMIQKWHCKPAESPSIIVPSCGVVSSLQPSSHNRTQFLAI